MEERFVALAMTAGKDRQSKVLWGARPSLSLPSQTQAQQPSAIGFDERGPYFCLKYSKAASSSALGVR